MARTLSMISFYFVMLALKNSLINSNGLTVRMIHPDSEESPYFQPNLSNEARIRRSVYQSNLREKYLANVPSSILQPEIGIQLFLFMVKIGIGTFKSNPPYKEYYLSMDTCSELVWTQCDGCKKCFKQTSKPFPKQNSLTFHPILNGREPLSYKLEYEDGSSTSGILAEEAFHLKSNTGSITKISKVRFGCGLDNNMQYGKFKNNKISGVMGLGWGNLSFLNQVGIQTNGRFSYCLPTVSKKMPKMHLRFGHTVLMPQDARSTPMYMVNTKKSYYIEMQGISINKKRLNINPKVFELKNGGRLGGCIFDSGTIYSRIISPAFVILKSELEKHFSGFKKIKGDLGLELCYERNKSQGYNNLPDITFHFQGSQVDFVMKPQAAFEVVVNRSLFKFREYFCLAMLRSDIKSTIGSHQQTNQRIIYDTKNKSLIFVGDDCSKNS